VNLLLFNDGDRLAPARIAIRGQRLKHLLQVHRAQVGDRLRVGEVGGLVGEGEVVEITEALAVLEVALDESPPPKLPLTLVLALPRPKTLRRILRSATEFGVAEIHLINSYRVEKSYWQSPLLQEEAVRECLLLGLAQCRDTLMPHVELHRRFKPFVEDTLPAMLTGRRSLLAHPGDYPPCPGWGNEPTLLVIGPEGGFIPYEVERLQEAGCDTVTLGPRILRVETAVSALLGRLSQAL
jgi:RsmE family RNA methyltransferase